MIIERSLGFANCAHENLRVLCTTDHGLRSAHPNHAAQVGNDEIPGASSRWIPSTRKMFENYNHEESFEAPASFSTSGWFLEADGSSSAWKMFDENYSRNTFDEGWAHEA